MNMMLITLIVIMTTIAMVVYILKKETNLLGKRYDKEYETDITKVSILDVLLKSVGFLLL